MASLIQRYPEPLSRNGDSFSTLARAIVGQQISIRAADAVWERLELIVGEVKPTTLIDTEPERLGKAGLSRFKVRYLHHLACYFVERRIEDVYWHRRSLEEISKELLTIPGIGPWTVEMFAIFHLQEPDIFSPADVGLQKAVGALYFGGAAPDRITLEEFATRWRPFRTVAAWYLWRHLDPIPVRY